VLALRDGGQQTFGDFIYQDAAYIGGPSTVRLGRERRFAGDASLYGSAELRLALTKFFVVIPGELGLFGLGDVGRVFVDGETSDVWHGAWGGGVWIAALSRRSTVTAAYAVSEERSRLYVQGGWAF
jgi:hemolysin activation/secretion protein